MTEPTLGPDDLSAIQADDALLDTLGGADPDITGSLADQQLNALLLSWRREVDSTPFADLVDVDTAVATIEAASKPLSPRHRLLVPLATAAAVLVIAFTGMSLVARDAQPGDALWSLTRVLYADHARSVEAAAAVRTDLDSAKMALREGRLDDAKTALNKASASLPAVASDEGKADLAHRHEELVQQLTGTTSAVPSTQVSSSVPVSSTTVPQSSATPSSEPPTSAVTTTIPPTSVVPSTTVPSSPPPPPTLSSTFSTGQSRGESSGPTLGNTPGGGTQNGTQNAPAGGGATGTGTAPAGSTGSK
ncbi:anti-sigma-D factor RsdA [Solihabitans fulvus]|uniref:anti-sigma-D factor RsdA n=1 Tax=Solihabitans fulvus TaxID=1892852 RepID=UPI001661DCD9|nr:anti-sigma-D factor RsdA [Solihabitans fulvus]